MQGDINLKSTEDQVGTIHWHMVLVPKFRLIDCRGSEIIGVYAVYHLGIMVVSIKDKV